MSTVNNVISNVMPIIWAAIALLEWMAAEEKEDKIYPFTTRRLRPLRWEMNCVCYLLDSAS